MLETSRPTLARPLLDLVLKEPSAPGDVAMALYLDGRRLQQAGRLDDALKRWDEVAATNDRQAQARALFARAMALLDAGRASRAETIKALDALRFIWRGGNFEFTLLRKLGELQLAEGDEGAALEALRGAATDFPDNRAAQDVAKETSDAFATFFLGDKGNDLAPLKALALYDQFHDLEPVGRAARQDREEADRSARLGRSSRPRRRSPRGAGGQANERRRQGAGRDATRAVASHGP